LELEQRVANWISPLEGLSDRKVRLCSEAGREGLEEAKGRGDTRRGGIGERRAELRGDPAVHRDARRGCDHPGLSHRNAPSTLQWVPGASRENAKPCN
jgi:hypothetical protein